MPIWSRIARATFVPVCLLLLTVAGCAGGSATPAAGNPEPVDSGLPAPGVIKAASGMVLTGGYIAGDEYDEDLPARGASPDGGRLNLRPADAAGMAYAVYSLQLDGVTLDDRLALNWMVVDGNGFVLDPVQVRGDAWIGLADHTAGTWAWFDLTAECPPSGSLADYVEDNRLLIAVVSTADYEIRINSLRVAPSNWVVEEIDFPEHWDVVVVSVIDSEDRLSVFHSRHMARQTATGWEIDRPSDYDYWTAGQVLDARIGDDGVMHICSFKDHDWGLGAYDYSRNAGTGWEAGWAMGVGTTVDPFNGYQPYSGCKTCISFALDDEGRSHFAFFDEGERDLYYSGPLTDGTWSCELIDADGLTGEQCRIMYDAAGVLHIFYHAADHTAVRHASNDGSGWRIEELFSGTSHGLDLCMTGGDVLTAACTLDPGNTGNPVVRLYIDDGIPRIEDLGHSSGGGCFLAVKQDGTPDLLYRRYRYQPLRVEARRGDHWDHYWVDVPDEAELKRPTYNVSFLLDSRDRPHVFYATWLNGDRRVMHAYQVE